MQIAFFNNNNFTAIAGPIGPTGPQGVTGATGPSFPSTSSTYLFFFFFYLGRGGRIAPNPYLFYCTQTRKNNKNLCTEQKRYERQKPQVFWW